MAKTDVTPDSQRARYEARKRPEKTTADFMDEEFEAGRKQGAAEARTSSSSSSSRRVGFTAPSSVPSIAAPMLVELIIISSDDFFNQHRAPLPSRLLAVFGIFGVLGLAKGNAARPAQAFAWALVLSSLYASAGPKGQGGALGALAKLGDFMSGKYGKTTTTKKAGP